MFLRIVSKDSGVDSLYECQRIHTHWARSGGEPLHFDMQTHSSEQVPTGNYGVTIDFPEPAMIYIMNDSGKTIDSIEHNPGRQEHLG